MGCLPGAAPERCGAGARPSCGAGRRRSCPDWGTGARVLREGRWDRISRHFPQRRGRAGAGGRDGDAGPDVRTGPRLRRDRASSGFGRAACAGGGGARGGSAIRRLGSRWRRRAPRDDVDRVPLPRAPRAACARVEGLGRGEKAPPGGPRGNVGMRLRSADASNAIHRVLVRSAAARELRSYGRSGRVSPRRRVPQPPEGTRPRERRAPALVGGPGVRLAATADPTRAFVGVPRLSDGLYLAASGRGTPP